MLATQVKQDDDKGDSNVKERKVCYSAVFLGRNSKEMVRQVSGARELASATVSKCF